ncbi:hypothetical protein V1264_016995 [Littorina saxatilis]|uniref:Transposase Tc1-like domain-containing protein n=1 Tax=Littorina saxatilis TaxID=31220 RepID=A0AAN9BLR7_9CAEN
MPPRRKVTTFNKARAIAWLQDGVSKRKVGRRLGVSHSVAARLHQKFQATNIVLERPRSGRPKKTTQREDRFISRQALQQRGTTANIIRGQLRVATNTNISTKTIRKRLHEVGLRSRRPAVRPRLTAAHRQARLPGGHASNGPMCCSAMSPALICTIMTVGLVCGGVMVSGTTTVWCRRGWPSAGAPSWCGGL